MSQPPLNNPGARYWDDLVEEFDFSPDEKREMRAGADGMIAEVRARRLAGVRDHQNATQVEVAARHRRPPGRRLPDRDSARPDTIGLSMQSYSSENYNSQNCKLVFLVPWHQ